MTVTYFEVVSIQLFKNNQQCARIEANHQINSYVRENVQQHNSIYTVENPTIPWLQYKNKLFANQQNIYTTITNSDNKDNDMLAML